MLVNVIPFSIPIKFDTIVHVNRVLPAYAVKRISMIVKVSFVRKTIRNVSMGSIRSIANVKSITNEVSDEDRRRSLDWFLSFVSRLGWSLCRTESLWFIALSSEFDLLQFKWWTISLYLSADHHWHSMRWRYWWMCTLSFYLSEWWNVRILIVSLWQIDHEWRFVVDVWMKSDPIVVIVLPVGRAQHVPKPLIIVFLNHVSEMEHVSIK